MAPFIQPLSIQFAFPVFFFLCRKKQEQHNLDSNISGSYCLFFFGRQYNGHSTNSLAYITTTNNLKKKTTKPIISRKEKEIHVLNQVQVNPAVEEYTIRYVMDLIINFFYKKKKYASNRQIKAVIFSNYILQSHV